MKTKGVGVEVGVLETFLRKSQCAKPKHTRDLWLRSVCARGRDDKSEVRGLRFKIAEPPAGS